jgi:hypothetical protein
MLYLHGIVILGAYSNCEKRLLVLPYLSVLSVHPHRTRENQNTPFMFNNFFLENHTVYEMWKNMEQTDRPHDNIIRRIHFTYCITKATHTHKICNVSSTRQQWLRERASMLHLYLPCLWCSDLPTYHF